MHINEKLNIGMGVRPYNNILTLECPREVILTPPKVSNM